jgi:hypothetical protein
VTASALALSRHVGTYPRWYLLNASHVLRLHDPTACALMCGHVPYHDPASILAPVCRGIDSSLRGATLAEEEGGPARLLYWHLVRWMIGDNGTAYEAAAKLIELAGTLSRKQLSGGLVLPLAEQPWAQSAAMLSAYSGAVILRGADELRVWPRPRSTREELVARSAYQDLARTHLFDALSDFNGGRIIFLSRADSGLVASRLFRLPCGSMRCGACQSVECRRTTSSPSGERSTGYCIRGRGADTSRHPTEIRATANAAE